ncbi:serine incorporator 5-like [Tigriopus californicus]|nr:serine incorporator 5-like [Tigriopus californicus]
MAGGGIGEEDEEQLLPTCCPIRVPLRFSMMHNCKPSCASKICPQWSAISFEHELKRSKCLYVLAVVFTAITMGSVTIPSFQRHLHRIFRDLDATCKDLKMGNNCMRLTGYMAVFKIAFAVTVFFLALALITLRLPEVKRGRAHVHNRMWPFKGLMVVLLIIAAFVVPISHLNTLHTSWIYTCHIGNWIFIVVQTIYLVQVSNQICMGIQKRATYQRLWRLLELGSSISVVSIWVIMSITLFLIHGQRQYCLTKQLILISNTGLCCTIILASITPCARGSGRANLYYDQQAYQSSMYANRLIQSGLVVVYTTFWIWSAMQSSPEQPGAVETSFLMDEDDIACRSHRSSRFVEDSLTGTAVVMAAFTLIYITSKWEMTHELKEQKSVAPSTFGGNALPATQPGPTSPKARDTPTTYQISLFHLFLILVIMHLTTQLTKWFHPDGYSRPDFEKSWTIVVIKVASGWSAAFLYLLYLLLPTRCIPTQFQDSGTTVTLEQQQQPQQPQREQPVPENIELNFNPRLSNFQSFPIADLRQNLGHI